MKLTRLNITKTTRTTGDSISLQKNGRVRVSASLAEKLEFKEGDSIDIFLDEEDKRFIYVSKGSMYKLFRHVRNSNSALYFGSAAMFKELGIETLSLHSLTSKIMKFKNVLYLQLDLSELLPKVLKPVEATKPANNNKTEEPQFIG